MKQRFSVRKTIETTLITFMVGTILGLTFDFFYTYGELKALREQNAKKSRERGKGYEELSRIHMEDERLRQQERYKLMRKKHLKYC